MENIIIHFELIEILKAKADITINWLESNKLIVNPEKFHTIFVQKDRQDTEIFIQICKKTIKYKNWVKLFSVRIDHELSVSPQKCEMYETASQLNATCHLKPFLGFQKT